MLDMRIYPSVYCEQSKDRRAHEEGTMATITVTIQYRNRVAPRVYEVSGENFDAIKDAIKATGARYDSLKKRWQLPNKQALADLQAAYQVTARDIIIRDNAVVMAADGAILYAPEFRNEMGAHVHDPARLVALLAEVQASLQVAYSVNDATFAQAYQELRDQGSVIRV